MKQKILLIFVVITAQILHAPEKQRLQNRPLTFENLKVWRNALHI